MDAQVRSCRLPHDLGSVTAGRHFVRDALATWGLGEVSDDAQLCVTELLANAVKHAGTALTLTVTFSEHVLVAVLDGEPRLTSPVPASDALAENGRGLRIIAALSSDWGVRAREEGKEVWFSLPLPDGGRRNATVFSIGDGRQSERGHERSEGNASATNSATG